MENQSKSEWCSFWFVTLIAAPSLVLCVLLFDSSSKHIIILRSSFANPIIGRFYDSTSPLVDDSRRESNQTQKLLPDEAEASGNEGDPTPILLADETDPSGTDSCSGRYIYMHDLPSKFNVDVLTNCSVLIKWFDMCVYLLNMGFGPQVSRLNRERSWYATNQFVLELIFHNRMKNYECLTYNSSLASAIYIPFYTGFDIGRHLWGYDRSVRDELGLGLVKWLASKLEWQRMWGRDHFFVVGRISWDFHRPAIIKEGKYDWGSQLFNLPEVMNTTILSIETTSWSNEFGVPYPTYFHPSKADEISRWQKRMRRQERPYLFSFTGSPRSALNDSIRGEVIKQCSSSKECYLLACNQNNCDNPVEVIKVFRKSVFCLQPPGDSYSRRSIFDAILAGCIPVMFHPFSAYAQYTWFLPNDYWKYSVFISEKLVKEGNADIAKTLQEIPMKQVAAMRKEVITLIPKISYRDPRIPNRDTFEDAFDIAVKGVLKRIADLRKRIKEGKDPSEGFAVENSWRRKLNGTGEVDEWESFL